MHYHSIKETQEQLHTNIEKGLTTKEVSQKTHPTFKNELEEKKRKNFLFIFLSQLNDPLIYILGVALLISLFLREYVDAAIILTVVILNAIIGAVEENKAEKALEALKKMTTPHCLVKRNNEVVEIEAKDLVLGDVVILDAGRTIPADLRLTKTNNLKIDESSLTGESLPVEKDANLILPKNTPLGDCKNMAYMSTNVTYGRAEGVVTHIGMNTQIGKIAKMLNEKKDEMTPLQKKLAELGKLLGIIAVSVCILLLVVALIQGRNLIEMLITSISLAVAAIPEGLPAVVTIVLSLGVQKMVKVNTIVRKLHSVETLGAVNIICSDKTGTLTQNKMTVVQAYFNHQYYNSYQINQNNLYLLSLGMSLCNDAKYEKEKYIGDPTEIALLVFSQQMDMFKADLDKKYPRLQEIPFDSNRKMMSTLHKVNGKNMLFTKGAIDQIIQHCNRIICHNVISPLSVQDKNKLLLEANNMAKNAMRVLALAFKETNQLKEEELVFVGFVGMIDPPRKEAIEAIQKLKTAGIKTVMITGDHKNTALAIAKELDIATDESQCISGEEIDKIDDFEQKVENYSIFARVSPEHKVKIVKALKEKDNIVAMTGDGVNDAPSLKMADIGISMGITGTDVAKSASDMVLSDDNFASIEKAVKEGRGIYTNIKKSLLFLLSSNIGEILTMFLGILLNLPIPLLAVHILWVNLLTDSFPALALGQDDNGDELMKEKPRNAKESLFAHGGMKILIGYGLLIGFVSLAAYLIVPIFQLLQSDTPITYQAILMTLRNPIVVQKAQTYAFCTLALSQLFHSIGMKNMTRTAFDSRFMKNKLLIASFIIGYVLQILVTELPFLNQAFKTTHLYFQDWIIITLFSMLPLVIHEIIALFLKLIKKKSHL